MWVIEGVLYLCFGKGCLVRRSRLRERCESAPTQMPKLDLMIAAYNQTLVVTQPFPPPPTFRQRYHRWPEHSVGERGYGGGSRGP